MKQTVLIVFVTLLLIANNITSAHLARETSQETAMEMLMSNSGINLFQTFEEYDCRIYNCLYVNLLLNIKLLKHETTDLKMKHVKPSNFRRHRRRRRLFLTLRHCPHRNSTGLQLDMYEKIKLGMAIPLVI